MGQTKQQEPREHLYEILRDHDIAMIVTRGLDGALLARPMSIARVDQGGEIYFATNVHSAKVEEIKANPEALVTVQGKSKYAAVYGRARVVVDRSLIAELWKESWRIWFKGKEDPDICLLAFDPERGELWDNSGLTGLTFVIKAAKAYVTGAPPPPSQDENAKVNLR
jgi:general stress protein 26